jgi:hypothetical protein
MLPRDLYGLPLTTTAAGAEFYNIALGRLLRVQPGADAALRAAVRADPDFALAHAGLALLGHEHGVPVDVRASLDAADKAARRITDREYSQLAAITARVSGAGPRLLRQHLRMYPRAGRVPDAHALLARRLDRRPSRRDMSLLCCAVR